MKKKILVLLLILTIVCSIFALVACKDPNEASSGDLPSGVGSGEGNPPSGEISSGDNNQDDDNEQGGDEERIEELIPAYKNFKGEEIDYSLYFTTDGNGKIIGLSDYAIEKREEIIQLEIPEKIGDEDITALSITFESLPYLRSLIIPDNIQIIEKTINQGDFLNFLVIYCEASSKPQGWCVDWRQEYIYASIDIDNIKVSAVVWDCKSNEKADDGKAYCFAPSGMLYALEDSQAELAFSGKSDVENLELASAVKYKNGKYTLIGFYPMTFVSVDIEKDDPVIQNYTNLKSVKIPNGVTSIGNFTFYFCVSMTSIEIPSSVTSIGDYSFVMCDSMTNIEIPSGVTSIGDFAFSGCTGLSSIGIPSSLTTIGVEAFSGCRSLTSIEIPSNVTSIGGWVFGSCVSLESITVDENNKKFKSEGNCLIEKETNVLISGCKNSVIPNYVTSIGDGAFAFCSGLISIEIPKSVTSIGDRAFYSSGLTSIEISRSVTNIGKYAFSGCNNLKGIVIPSSVTSIGEMAFLSCNSLTIYCEAESQPSGWSSNWNMDNNPVVWGYNK